jgi:hypothetical protein
MAGYNALSLIGNALKEVFEDGVTDLVTADHYMLQTVEKADPREFDGGHRLEWLVDIKPNTSLQIGDLDGTVLPTPGRREQIRALTRSVVYMGSTSVTQESIDVAKGGPASFFRVVEKAKDEVLTDLRTPLSAGLYRPLRYSVLADSTGTTLTLSDVQYLRVGDKIIVGNRTTGASPVTRTIVSKNITAKTVVVDAATTVTAAASGIWYPGAGPADTRLLNSLDLAASVDRTLHGIDSTTYDVWDGNETSLSNTAADESDFIKLINRIWERGEKVAHGLTTSQIQTDVASGFQSQKRFVDAQSVQLKGGFKGLVLSTPNGDVPLVSERGVPKGRAYVYANKAFRMYKGEQRWESTPDGGDSIWRWVRNGDGDAMSEYAATYSIRMNLLFEKPRGVGRLTNVLDGDPVE